MRTTDQQIAVTSSLLDQCWAHAEERMEDIARIAEHGPASDEDSVLIRSVLSTVMAETCYRQGLRELGELEQ